MTVADHNAERWLAVVYLDAKPPGVQGFFSPGWHVIRTCYCHQNEPVTLALETRDEAESAMRAMLKVAS